MEKIAWSESFLLGDANVDRSHQLFLAELNLVLDAPDSALAERLFSLIKQMENDFFQEEVVMEKTRYADIKPHREQHARVLSTMHELVPEVMQGNFNDARIALNLLPQWLVMHIVTVDRPFVAHVKALGSSSALVG